ncbi:hypothetical protein, partial [Endozoicomonas sp. ONNA2]|uniref:hypothetical protein n=1 Tax=Endozoicomonas sp. ONNA2 TaxID=2828741 RepID=UPI0021479CB3
MRIEDALNLGKICRDEEFPCDGEYSLAMNISGNTLNESIDQINGPFTGKLFGNKFTISGLRHCLVKHLAGDGLIENLRLTKPIIIIIQGSGPVGVAACKISGNANVRNIEVEGADVLITGETVHAGIAVGMVEGGTVSNTRAKKCSVTVIALGANASTVANAGIGAGKVAGGGKVINTIADNCKVRSEHQKNANAGIGVGQSVYSTVTGTKAENCHVTAIHAAGIGVGRSSESTINDTKAHHCTVSTSSFDSGAGIGAGISSVSKITGTNALNCTVSTAIAESDAGIGAGRSIKSKVTDTNAVNCTVSTSSSWSDAGIGAGSSKHSTVANTKARHCRVST